MDSSSNSEFSTGNRNRDEFLRILVATDIHLGYAEKNNILCN